MEKIIFSAFLLHIFLHFSVSAPAFVCVGRNLLSLKGKQNVKNWLRDQLLPRLYPPDSTVSSQQHKQQMTVNAALQQMRHPPGFQPQKESEAKH